jgi:hypothetical protein
MIKSFLSENYKAIILGSILGDGSLKIHPPYQNARFSFRHSIRQKEYFFWKVGKLKEISGTLNHWFQKADGYGGEKLRYQSRAIESLTELYRLTHNGGRIKIRRRWLNQLTPLSLAIWWLDDGSLIVNSRRGVLCTDPFSYDEQELLQKYLSVVWGVRVHIAKTARIRDEKRTEYYRLWFRSSEELQKFLRLVLPYVKVASMLPKVLLLYKNPELQQRWISEVCKLTGFSQSMVERAVREKKAKWKTFR